jgi:N-acetylmuramoyl-L-alanine amidase
MKRIVILVSSLLCAGASMAAGETICIDAGHGGDDPGGTGCSLEEAPLVLDVAQRLEPLLEAAGFVVIQTRTTDVFVPLAERTDYANAQGADRFTSIHANAFNSSANGTETFCHTSGGTSIDLRDRIQTEMISAWDLVDRGGKTANFYVLANTSMAATLSELGFVDSCAVDALVLADPDQRQLAAVAHLNAIAGHLGVDIGDPPPPPVDGRLLGVVYINEGLPAADSTRISGATVELVGTGLTTTSTSSLWEFTVDAGAYTVRASAPGYITNERTCTAVANDDIFCSIGLLPEAAEGEGEPAEGEGEPVVGEGEGEEGEGEPTVTGEGEGEPTGEGEEEPTVQRVIIRNNNPSGPKASGGCDCGGGASLLLPMLLLTKRRRRAMTTLTLMAMLVAVPAVAADDVLLWSSSPTMAQLSQDGRHLLVADAQYHGLAVVTVAGGDTVQLTDAKRAGFRAVWLSHDVVAHRAAKPFRGQPLRSLQAVARVGGPTIGTWVGLHNEHPQWVVRQVGDQVLLSPHTDEVEPNEVRKDIDQLLSPADARCFAPQLHRNGVVVFQCLGSGVWLTHVNDRKLHGLGAGSQPSLSHDGNTLVFVDAADEGHRLVSADLVIADLRGPVPVLSKQVTPGVMERSPSLDEHGTHLAFVTEAGVFLRQR